MCAVLAAQPSTAKQVHRSWHTEAGALRTGPQSCEYGQNSMILQCYHSGATKLLYELGMQRTGPCRFRKRQCQLTSATTAASCACGKHE